MKYHGIDIDEVSNLEKGQRGGEMARWREAPSPRQFSEAYGYSWGHTTAPHPKTRSPAPAQCNRAREMQLASEMHQFREVPPKLNTVNVSSGISVANQWGCVANPQKI